MDRLNGIFMEALCASLNQSKVQPNNPISAEDWAKLFSMANMHHVLPMIYEAVYDHPSFLALGAGYMMQIKRPAIQKIMMQTLRTDEFQRLFEYLRENGITPCVVKGVICRNLYPNPDARTSSDEDVFIPEEQFSKCHNLLLQYGMVLEEPDMDIENVCEVPYRKPGSTLFIELHKHMFSPESEAYGDLNRFFDGIHDRKEQLHEGNCGLTEETIHETKFLSMNPTDHLLYLILHSFKHFLHSGFGLRQVCDINLFAMKYGKEIDWDYVLLCCQEIRADLFAAAMFKIGEKYLTFDPVKAQYPEVWRNIPVDESAMLEDLLASGVFGQADMSRRHSSNITLNAMIADRRGEKAEMSKVRTVVSSVFLPLDMMSDRFKYLKRMPFLLPVAWIQRVWIYLKETKSNKTDNNAMESIKIGNERVELMRQYGIIK